MSNVKVLTRDPADALAQQLGTATEDARDSVFRLVGALRSLDATIGKLREHGIDVKVDLGPIGNAAQAARRDLERQNDRPSFRLPQ